MIVIIYLHLCAYEELLFYFLTGILWAIWTAVFMFSSIIITNGLRGCLLWEIIFANIYLPSAFHLVITPYKWIYRYFQTVIINISLSFVFEIIYSMVATTVIFIRSPHFYKSIWFLTGYHVDSWIHWALLCLFPRIMSNFEVDKYIDQAYLYIWFW